MRAIEGFDRAEAAALLRSHVAGHEARLAELAAAIERQPWPPVDLDDSPDSLVPLWNWVEAALPRPDRPATDEEMRRSDPPWWYEIWPPLGRSIGPDAARLVGPIASYLAEVIIRARPGSTWTMANRRDLEPSGTPILAVAGLGRFSPESRLLSYLSQRAGGAPHSPQQLLFLYSVVMGVPVVAPDADAAPAPYSMARGRPDAFETEIVFDEAVAWDEDRRIERLITDLAQVPGVERAIREDREVVLVRAPSIADSDLEQTIERLWHGRWRARGRTLAGA